jgi:anti-sigma factor RsiW
VVPALATAAVLLMAVPIYYGQIGPLQSDRPASMVTEAVTNHLRVLSSQHPLDIESGNMHQVKPWYEGRLDFAPVVRFLGDEEFPLAGGAIGYFLDRKAAVFVFHRHCTRSHSSCSPHGDYRGPRVVSHRWVLSGPTCPTTGGSTSSSGARASRDMP